MKKMRNVNLTVFNDGYLRTFKVANKQENIQGEMDLKDILFSKFVCSRCPHFTFMEHFQGLMQNPLGKYCC
jgi:hypothetical protein